ncbi:MAG: beta-aspartyl-peptidase [Gammaproteobacteria bacterium]|nr:beta-aspartyl-peptidase [Gammaproteobacteria bacterium]
MFKLLTNAQVFAPQPLGLKAVLACAGKIVYIGDDVPILDSALQVETTDLQGATLVPGLIDGHTHITGGGGESGPASRVPAPFLSQFTQAGVTSVVGLLGTDDLTRNTQTLVTQAYGLRQEGLSAWCFTGGYHVPLTTLTGSARADIVNLDPVIGIGELAISDHRSSQPSLQDILTLASEAHVAGLMTGKAGLLHLHLGDGERGLDLVRKALAESELPARVFHPTHVNRNKPLFEEACALVAEQGCTVDLTAFAAAGDAAAGVPGWSAAEAILRYRKAGLPANKLTVSSDGGGCLSSFNAAGEVQSMDIGNSRTLLETMRALAAEGLGLDDMLAYFTSNVAALLRLPGKGLIAAGMDADLLVLDAEFRVQHLMARGNWHIKNGQLQKPGSFEAGQAK